MTRMMIEVNNEETLKLIQNLENLHLIKVLTQPTENLQIDESWIGSISEETGEAMLAHVAASKEEWERNF